MVYVGADAPMLGVFGYVGEGKLMQRLMTTGALVVLLVALLATGALAKNIRERTDRTCCTAPTRQTPSASLRGPIRYSAGVGQTCCAATVVPIRCTAAVVPTGYTVASLGIAFTVTLATTTSSPKTARRTSCIAAPAGTAQW